MQRVEYAVEKRLAELAAEEQSHVVDVIRSVTDGLVRADTRDEVASTLVERLTDARPYAGACVVDEQGIGESAGECASVPADALARLVGRDGAAGDGTMTWTVEGDQFVAEDGATVELAVTGVRSAVVTPITYSETTYGHLVVLSTRSVVDERQRAVLTQLAETAGYAIDAVETRERLERQNERLDEFASLVSHDLRNPMNVVSGRVDILSAEHDSEHFDPIRRSVTRMEQIIEDMLALARDGQIATDLEPLSLATTAEDVWADFDADATLVVAGDRELRADYGALCELFENLFRNALEHAGPDVTVTVGPLDDGFFVDDDGPGIPEADREQVFEYGYTTDSEGTGYGLPIVRRLADAHGWTVTVAASESGARFEVRGAG